MKADRRFFSRVVSELPGDPSREPGIRQVLGACYTEVQPTPVKKPHLLAHSREMAETLGFDEDYLQSERFSEVFGGNDLEPGMVPYAACYGGHQFGNWAGQLGDGRAISLGEVIGADGQAWELQLKGAGPTPYSRRADGRAVLRSSVREFLCSEAMHHLGVPTTRALSLVGTGEQVVRDMFYDGHPAYEPGAVVCRVAPSFVRFGNFEIFASRGDEATLRTLAEFCLRHWFSDLVEVGRAPGAEQYAAMFEHVCRSTARLMVEWMRVGFVHGVMNTDNMSLLGLTIDYGPYGWLEDFDPSWTPNTTDAHGRRYRYGNQPRVGEWNLAQLGNALMPLVGDVAMLEVGMEAYRHELGRRQAEMMAAKLGLQELRLEDLDSEVTDGPHQVPNADRRLIDELFDLLQATETDMTLFYRHLADLETRPEAVDQADADRLRAPLEPSYYQALTPDVARQTDAWLRRYLQRVHSDFAQGHSTPDERRSRMNRTNPKYVLRNYLAQLAIDRATEGEPEAIGELLEVLRHPYDDQPGNERYAERRPEWARHRAGCSMLSCSS